MLKSRLYPVKGAGATQGACRGLKVQEDTLLTENRTYHARLASGPGLPR